MEAWSRENSAIERADIRARMIARDPKTGDDERVNCNALMMRCRRFRHFSRNVSWGARDQYDAFRENIESEMTDAMKAANDTSGLRDIVKRDVVKLEKKQTEWQLKRKAEKAEAEKARGEDGTADRSAPSRAPVPDAPQDQGDFNRQPQEDESRQVEQPQQWQNQEDAIGQFHEDGHLLTGQPHRWQSEHLQQPVGHQEENFWGGEDQPSTHLTEEELHTPIHPSTFNFMMGRETQSNAFASGDPGWYYEDTYNPQIDPAMQAAHQSSMNRQHVQDNYPADLEHVYTQEYSHNWRPQPPVAVRRDPSQGSISGYVEQPTPARPQDIVSEGLQDRRARRMQSGSLFNFTPQLHLPSADPAPLVAHNRYGSGYEQYADHVFLQEQHQGVSSDLMQREEPAWVTNRRLPTPLAMASSIRHNQPSQHQPAKDRPERNQRMGPVYSQPPVQAGNTRKRKQDDGGDTKDAPQPRMNKKVHLDHSNNKENVDPLDGHVSGRDNPSTQEPPSPLHALQSSHPLVQALHARNRASIDNRRLSQPPDLSDQHRRSLR